MENECLDLGKDEKLSMRSWVMFKEGVGINKFKGSNAV